MWPAQDRLPSVAQATALCSGEMNSQFTFVWSLDSMVSESTWPGSDAESLKLCILLKSTDCLMKSPRLAIVNKAPTFQVSADKTESLFL
ncbi:hypothetical protein VTH06DRAFT_1679 [Thermothelomyces fergusii]